MGPIQKLSDLSRAFGPEAAAGKARLMEEIGGSPRLSLSDRRLLADTLQFIRAYPDDPRVLTLARKLCTSLPDAVHVHPWSYGVLQRLVRLTPGRLEIDWDEVESEDPLTDALYLLTSLAESHGLEEISLTLQEWIQGSKPRPELTDLEFLMNLLEASPHSPQLRAFLLENAQLPVRYRGPALPRLGLDGLRISYQKGDLDRTAFPLPRLIRKRPRRLPVDGRELIDLSVRTLCARKLEIYPLTYANPADVVLVSGGRGIQVALAGVQPDWRGALEALYFFLVLKNGVPIAYGPARVLLGCCELGINLFPEFRGGETRHIYARFMQALHHHLGVEYFFLTRYGMGENNPDALHSGAFWFYRKLGFKPTNPEVEALARKEEARMAVTPSHRSDRKTLRRLSHTEAFLDLSDGRLRPLDLGRLGMAQSRFIGSEFRGDRALAQTRCTARLKKLLGVTAPGRAFRNLAPLLCMIPEIRDWSRRERAQLAVFLRAKDAPSEARAARLQAAHTRLGAALHRLGRAEGGKG